MLSSGEAVAGNVSPDVLSCPARLSQRGVIEMNVGTGGPRGPRFQRTPTDCH